MKEQDYIYEVYLERSFSKAAEKLFVSQPALSMAVKKTEEKLGITIFDRSSNPLSLTDEGRIYIDTIEEMRSLERSLKEKLSDIADLKFGHITVSGENFVSSFILPEVLMRFSKLYEGVEVELVESNSPDLRQLLLSEAIDLLVAHDFDVNLYEARELFEERVLLAVPSDLPINDTLKDFALKSEDILSGEYKHKPAVDLSLFKHEKFLLLKPGNDMYRRTIQLCDKAGFHPDTRIFLDQLITAYNLSCAGMGLTFVSDILVEKAASSGCVYYRLDGEIAHRKMYIGYKKNRYMNHAAKAFVDTAVEVFIGRNHEVFSSKNREFE